MGSGPIGKCSIHIVSRLLFRLLTLVAIGIRLFGMQLPHGVDTVNVFSYCTTVTNIFASVVFVVGAIWLLQLRRVSGRRLAARHRG